MLKVMLVDDEILVRLGIKSVFNWEIHGFRYVGDAADGHEALRLIASETPDIVLTDILMPNMNGLELIEAIKRQFPHIRILVLSSHDQYDYVRSAMKLGAHDYVLKGSLQPEKLLQVLSEVALSIAEEQRRADSVSQGSSGTEEEQLSSWMRGILANDVPLPDVEMANAADRIFRKYNHMMLVRLHHDGVSTVEDLTLQHMLGMHLRKWTYGRTISTKERECVLLLPVDEPAGMEHLEAIGKDLISAAKRVMGASISIGISHAFNGLPEWKETYESLNRTLQAYFFYGTERTYFSEPRDKIKEDRGIVLFSADDEKLLKDELARMDEDAAGKVVNAVLDRMKETEPAIETCIQACLQMLHCFLSAAALHGDEFQRRLESEGPKYKTIVGFETWVEAADWFNTFVRRYFHLMREAGRETIREDIHRLILYIRDNYHTNLSLKQAARRINVSEGYLSSLFKKETGIGLNAYINQIRVEKAEQLLRETGLPSYEIADKVGYENFNYFGRIFKKITGLNPMEYRKVYGRRKS